jgi:hypothetical protein
MKCKHYFITDVHINKLDGQIKLSEENKINEKMKKVICSCVTLSQLEVARKMLNQWTSKNKLVFENTNTKVSNLKPLYTILLKITCLENKISSLIQYFKKYEEIMANNYK